MIDAFRPNRVISNRAWTIILGVQVGALLFAWTFGSALLIPSPLEVLNAWFRLVKEEGLLYELGVSMKTNAEALGFSSIISIGLAYLTVLPVMRPIAQFISKSRFFGMSGFVVIFTMAFGGGHGLKVSLLVFAMSVFFITSMATVVSEIPREKFDHARSLRMGEWRIVLEVVILGKADQAFEALRQNAAIGWMMLTVVEGLVRSEGGIGALMLNQAKYMRLDAVFAAQITVLLIGIFQDQFLVWLKNAFCPHARMTLERR
jgi:NitT/TauT family transport system permease protein